MLIGVIADDFTGASDIANTLAKGGGGSAGLATTQFLGIPSGTAEAGCEAGVIALKSRSIPVDQAISQSLHALAWLRRQGCRQIVFKYCSTFDSTASGNIGPVGEALAHALSVRGVVVCPAFPAAGRTVYMGNLFVGDVPLNESSLRHHPLTPMTDSDLRRWLRKQSRDPVGFVPWTRVARGRDEIVTALGDARDRGETLVIVDALTENDLLAIGEACANVPLLTGGSGIGLGLPRNFHNSGLAGSGRSRFEAAPGREAVFAGSCSQATLAQIAHHERRHPVMRIAVSDIIDGTFTSENAVSFIEQHEGRAPLICTSQPPDEVRRMQERFGVTTAATAIEQLFADAAKSLVERGLRRLVVAGGETSGAVASALGFDAIEIGPEIAPGVPAVSAGQGRLALALKSGNFGEPDFFARALKVLEGTP
jgi:3-dehydrotetronate 4-kinase